MQTVTVVDYLGRFPVPQVCRCDRCPEDMPEEVPPWTHADTRTAVLKMTRCRTSSQRGCAEESRGHDVEPLTPDKQQHF